MELAEVAIRKCVYMIRYDVEYKERENKGIDFKIQLYFYYLSSGEMKI